MMLREGSVWFCQEPTSDPHLKKFHYICRHTESGNVYPKTVWCYNREEFEYLIDHWNRTKEWEYTPIMTPEAAKEAGFANFNEGDHICIDLPEGHATISVKTPDGNKLTFAFVPRSGDAKGHQCCDVQHHSGKENEYGTPKQKVILFGQGPTIARADYDDEEPTTLTTVLLPE